MGPFVFLDLVPQKENENKWPAGYSKVALLRAKDHRARNHFSVFHVFRIGSEVVQLYCTKDLVFLALVLSLSPPRGWALPENLGGDVRRTPSNPYPISPDPKFDTLFQT